MSVINVCGLLVHALPEHTDKVKDKIEREQGVEVHHITDDGRIIVTIESESRDLTGDSIHRIGRLHHVLSTCLVYQYFDEYPEQENLL